MCNGNKTQELETRIQQLEEDNKDLREDNKDLREKLNDALGKLAYYEGPNVPSSQQKMKKKTKLKSSTGKKRGAPNGHKGVSRKRKETKNIIVVSAEDCEKCGSKNVRLRTIAEKTSEDITPADEEAEVTRFVRYKLECMDCGHVFIAKDRRCPIKGRFGVNLMVLIVLLRFLPRAVLGKIVELLDYNHNFKITESSTNAVITRVAEGARKEYEGILKRVRRAKVVYADETSMPVLGKDWWLWIFRTDTEIAVVIRDSRAGKVPREILGEDFYNTVVRDGWKAYNALKRALVQRCWAHLMRKAEKYIDSVPGRHMHEKLRVMFKGIKEFIKEEHEEDVRKEKFMEFNKRMRVLIGYYSRYPELEDIITHIKNGGSDWFTCVLVEGVEPTNNLAEQAIREHVVFRKIIGALRSLNGARVYETLASVIATWRLNDVNIKKALEKMIVETLCLGKI